MFKKFLVLAMATALLACVANVQAADAKAPAEKAGTNEIVLDPPVTVTETIVSEGIQGVQGADCCVPCVDPCRRPCRLPLFGRLFAARNYGGCCDPCATSCCPPACPPACPPSYCPPACPPVFYGPRPFCGPRWCAPCYVAPCYVAPVVYAPVFVRPYYYGGCCF